MSYNTKQNVDSDILLDVINIYHKSLKKRNIKNSFIDIIKIGLNVVDKFNNINEQDKIRYLIQSIKIIIQEEMNNSDIVYGKTIEVLIHQDVINKIILLVENNLLNEILLLIQEFKVKKQRNICFCNLS